jgi:hypothetical protein
MCQHNQIFTVKGMGMADVSVGKETKEKKNERK